MVWITVSPDVRVSLAVHTSKAVEPSVLTGTANGIVVEARLADTECLPLLADNLGVGVDDVKLFILYPIQSVKTQ
jgi:hypothetical protein